VVCVTSLQDETAFLELPRLQPNILNYYHARSYSCSMYVIIHFPKYIILSLQVLLTDDYFSDANPRSMRRLMNVLYVMGRLLKAFNIEFNWDGICTICLSFSRQQAREWCWIPGRMGPRVLCCPCSHKCTGHRPYSDAYCINLEPSTQATTIRLVY
jgi:hypothetical protein